MIGRRLLQVAVAIGAVVPVVAGLAGVLLGPTFLSEQPFPVAADSHFRYLSGLLVGIGIAFWTTIPAIERQTGRFRLLTAIVVAGGLGRLVSLLVVGAPKAAMLFGLMMELGVTPALCGWQAIVARRARAIPGLAR